MDLSNTLVDILGVAVIWSLLWLEWRLVRWLLRPEWLIVKALWRGARAIARIIRQRRGG